jgi:hypothetical protein
MFNPAALRSCLERVGFERIRLLPPDEDPEHIFMLSASMQLGRIAERDSRPLPQGVRKGIRAAARRARALVRRNPERSEFITAVANRPDAAR